MDDCIVLDPQSGFYPRALGVISKMQRIPLFAQFELTARCNFNCRMCYIHMSDKRINELGKELTTDEWLRIAKEAKDLGTLYLSLTGGEIFMRSDFKVLYEEINKMGFLIQFMSNISMIDESVMEWLRESPPYRISTTLYGSNNEIYESVCGIKQGFDRFDRALGLLQDAGIPVSIKALVIKNNENDIPNMYEYAAMHGIRLNATYGVNKSVRGAKSEAELVRMTRKELPFIPDERTMKNVLKGHGPYLHHTRYLDDCGAYGNTLNVTWDGRIVLCSFMNEPYVNVCDRSLRDSWTLLMDKVDRIQKPEKCFDCKYEEYCLRCPGSLAAECGSYNTVTEAYCNRAKYLYNCYKGEYNNEKEI